MDRRSWLWMLRSSEKSPSKTKSSGSVSSHSERFSDDHDALRASPNDTSPNFVHSPEVSSKIEDDNEAHDTVKSLTEKLSAALLNINAKKDLVKQHAKVAEEAVSGWEKAETEVAALKQHLEEAYQKNSALDAKIIHLDGALKECVRELRQSREEQEQKIHDAIVKKTRVWEEEKFELECQLDKLRTELEFAKNKAASSVGHDMQSKLEASEKENSSLKVELLAQSKNLQMLIVERDLSVQAAEAASKQQLESIKKVAKLEAECRKLRSIGRQTSVAKDHKIANAIYSEAVTDSQSDGGERLTGLDNEASCSDSWATALIAELDQFKNEKASARNLASSIDIELMDDFLKMERLVSLPEADSGSSKSEAEADKKQGSSEDEIGAMHRQVTELGVKVEKLESEKIKVEVDLIDTRKQLDVASNLLTVAEAKLAEMRRELDLADKSKQLAMLELVDAEEKQKVLLSQLEIAQSEAKNLAEKASLLESEADKERTLATEFATKLEAMEAMRKYLETKLRSVYLEADVLHDKVHILERDVKEEEALCAQHAASVEVLVGERNVLESQIELANLEVAKIHEKASRLERELEKERRSSAEFVAKLETTEARRRASESELEIARSEVGKLCEKMELLEQKFDNEKAYSAVFATKYRSLEEEFSRRKRETECHEAASSNGELKVKQEKELTVAAGKLAECQRTIASLNWHLQLLTNFDNLMLEDDIPGLNGGFAHLNVQDT